MKNLVTLCLTVLSACATVQKSELVDPPEVMPADCASISDNEWKQLACRYEKELKARDAVSKKGGPGQPARIAGVARPVQVRLATNRVATLEQPSEAENAIGVYGLGWIAGGDARVCVVRQKPIEVLEGEPTFVDLDGDGKVDSSFPLSCASALTSNSLYVMGMRQKETMALVWVKQTDEVVVGRGGARPLYIAVERREFTYPPFKRGLKIKSSKGGIPVVL